jgi:hypothetical protein
VAAHKVKKKKNAASALPDVARATPGFTLLFNGRDLSGWTGGDQRWSVDLPNQSLVGHNLTGTKGNQHSWIYTERSFSNFRLRFEYRALPQTDSGISLRASPGARIDERVEIQLRGDHDGPISTGTIIGLRKDQGHPHTKPANPVTLRPPGAWNSVEIEFRGRRLSVAINGRAAQDLRFDERADSSMPGKKVAAESGRIALQSRLGHVEFRKIEIQELASPANRRARLGS